MKNREYRLIQKVKKLWKTHPSYTALGVFAVLILIFYGNTLLNDGFILDDRGLIEENLRIQSLRYLPNVVTGCTWSDVGAADTDDFCKRVGLHYRPVYTLSHLITWQISPNPQFFHFINLFYTLITAFLVFRFVMLIRKTYATAILSGVLFIVLPVNNEVVNWIAAESELLLVIFTLLAVTQYIVWRQKNSNRNLILVYIFYFLSMLSKETAFFLVPVIILTLDLILLRIPLKKLFKPQQIKIYALFAVPLFLYFFMRISVLGFGGAFLMSGNHLKGFTLGERAYAFFTLFVEYSKELLFPFPLRFFHVFSVQSDIFNMLFVLSLLGFLGFLFLVYVSLKKREHFIAFSLLWIFLSFLPMLIAFDMSGIRVYFDRYMFLSSIGVAMLVSHVLCMLWQGKLLFSKRVRRRPHQNPTVKMLIGIFLAGILVLSWVMIFPRNRAWKDSETFYPLVLQEKSDVHYIRRELASLYMEKGELERAKEEFDYLLGHAPADWKEMTVVYEGLGDYYRAQENFDKSLQYYQKSADSSTRIARDFVVYNEVGVLAMNKEHYLRGLVNFCQAIALLPDFQTSHNNYNAALGFVQTEYIDTSTLFEASKEQLEPADKEKVVFLEKRCLAESNTCQYAFAFDTRPGSESLNAEILPPFLISAVTSSGSPVEIINQSFDQDTNVIILETSDQYQDQSITFLFPNCQGRYYEASTKE